MKRILQAIGAAAVAAMPHAALALDSDTALDRFPSPGGRHAVSDTREWRGNGDTRRVDAVRAYRDGGRDDRHGSYRENRRAREWASASGWREAGPYRSSGSLIDVRPFGGAVERGSFYGTSGTANGSVIVVGLPDLAYQVPAFRYGGLGGGPKILDVEVDRLDRRPYGENGLAVSHVGTAKIIRIAPDFRRGMRREVEAREDFEATDGATTPFAELPREEQAVTVYPDTDMAERPVDPPRRRVAATTPPPAPPVPTPAPAQEPAAAGFLEPWTPNWLRDCVARHPDFDASLGTYMAADGKRRFCTGEP